MQQLTTTRSSTRPAARRSAPRPAPDGEEGYILIGVLFLVVLVLIALSVAAPKVAKDIQRDREIELMHRGLQYRRGIQLYYRKFHAYPPNMEALEKSNEIRFLRKRYKDPMTGKDEWKLIHFGEAKAPTAMGFFGQPLMGASGAGGPALAGTGPGGIGQSIGSPIGGSTTDQSSTNPTATAPGTNTGTTTDPTAPSAGTSAFGGSNTNPTGSIFGSSSTTGSGQTFGGGGIIGVESTSQKPSILVYKKKTKYNEWEFVYDPMSDQMMMQGGNNGGIGQPVGGTGGNTGAPGINSPGLNTGPGPGSVTPTPAPSTPTPPVTPPSQQ